MAAIVFWSKNYHPFLNVLDAIKDIYQRRFLFHFTINGFTGSAKVLLEPHVPSEEVALGTAAYLAENYGAEAVLWRFDPILFSNLTPPEERLAAFKRLAHRLHNKVKRCYISILDMYAKVRRRLQQPLIQQQLEIQEVDADQLLSFVAELHQIAGGYDIQLFTCCENWLADKAGLTRGHCIDSQLLQRLYPEVEFTQRLHPTRPECGCFDSIDIGTYNTCQHRCHYCYANR